MMSHKSRYRFDLTRTLACNRMIADVLMLLRIVVAVAMAATIICSIDFNISRDFAHVLLMLEIDDFI